MGNKEAKRYFLKMRSLPPIRNDWFGRRSVNGASGESLVEVDVLKMTL